MPSFNPTGTETNFGSTTSDTSTAGSLTGTGSDLGDAITGLGGPDTSGTLTDLSGQGAAVDPNIGTTDPSSGGSDAGNISSLLSSLGTSGLGNLALAGGAYGLLSSQASATQGQNNALAGQISAIGQPAVTAGQGLLSAFQGGTLTAPYASQYQNAVAQNQQAATSEQQQSGQLLANAGGGNVQGAQAGEYQQITQQQALANSNALNQSFMNELSASLNLTAEGGGFVQSGIQQEIQSNTQLQGQLSQLMAALAGAYVKSSGSNGGGGGGGGVNSLISGAKNAYSAYNNASKLLNGGTTAADDAAYAADSAQASQSASDVFASSGIGTQTVDTSGYLSDLSDVGSDVSIGSDASDLSDIGSFSSGADAAGAASTLAAGGSDAATLADLSAQGAAVSPGISAAGAGADAAGGGAGAAGSLAGLGAGVGILGLAGYGAWQSFNPTEAVNLQPGVSQGAGGLSDSRGLPQGSLSTPINTNLGMIDQYTGANGQSAQLGYGAIEDAYAAIQNPSLVQGDPTAVLPSGAGGPGGTINSEANPGTYIQAQGELQGAYSQLGGQSGTGLSYDAFVGALDSDTMALLGSISTAPTILG
jgi:hypothetical protein